MQKRITIHSASVINTKLILTANETITGLIPGERILVDSDHFSFIYIMENADEYTFLMLPEQIWPKLKEAMGQTLPVFLTFSDEEIELTNFQEEFENLINNIKGNGNYGVEMAEKVETLFNF
jgi:hypothetical protein